MSKSFFTLIVISIFVMGAGCSVKEKVLSPINENTTVNSTTKKIESSARALEQANEEKYEYELEGYNLTKIKPDHPLMPPRAEPSSRKLRTESSLMYATPTSSYKDTEFYVPTGLSLNSECLVPQISTTTPGDYWRFSFEARCPILGTLYLSIADNLKAEIRPFSSSYINEIFVHFTKNDKLTPIPELKLYTDLARNPDNGIAITYLNDNDIYVENSGPGIQDTSYYHFNGKEWKWLDLRNMIKSALLTEYEGSYKLDVSDNYLHISELSFRDHNETTLELYKKGVNRQHFILDRKTLKILWNGTVFEQAGV